MSSTQQTTPRASNRPHPGDPTLTTELGPAELAPSGAPSGAGRGSGGAGDEHSTGSNGSRGDEGSLHIAHEEDALCERVVAHVRAHRPSRPPPRVDEDALLSLRDQIATSRLEDVPALMAQMERISALGSRRGQAVAEPVDAGSPYFGHLRLKEEGRAVRDVLIGKTTHIDPREHIRIVDWRHAPISQLYYRYEEGSQYEETFGEREVEGTLVARRTVTIRDGVLRRVSAPQGSFVRTADGWKQLQTRAAALAGGQGSAVRAEHMRGVLGSGVVEDQREDRHLPEIAALLDPRQFELISQPKSGVIVIQGGAGSGKTTIGVHRMAYLAYQSAQRFAARKMLVVVGTPALRTYIAELLRALDLDGVRVVTFASWVRDARRKCFPWLKLPYEENTPAEVSRLKTDPAVLALLERRARAAAARPGRPSAHDALWLWAEVLSDRKSLSEAVLHPVGGAKPRLNEAQLERAWRWCADRSPAVAEWTPHQEEGEDSTIEGADGVVEAPDERATLDVEDDALLVRAYQALCGPLRDGRTPIEIEHLFVDEVQDLAAVDLAVLFGVVTKRQSITLAGDTSQRLHLDTGFADWRELLDSLEMAHVAVEPLRIAYRSTAEVLQVAQAVLGPLADADPPLAPRHGAPVEHHAFPSQGAAAAFLAENLRPLFVREPRATVAILARYPEQADAYYAALSRADVPNLRRVANYDFAFRPGVELTEIRQVKGLEYDYVILVDVNASTYPDRDDARYQLHIGATRAAHQLWVLSTGPVSPLLPEFLLQDDG